LIRVKDLDFAYGKHQILKGINFSIDEASVISLIGPNGSGKSTLLKCISGLLPVRDNTVYLFGKPIENLEIKERAKLISYLPQNLGKLHGVNVYELISMGRAPYHSSGWISSEEDLEKIDWAIEYMNLNSMVHRPVEKLSGGEKQRVWIAMILAQDTPIILLDEPTTYMDLKYQYELLKTLKDIKISFNKTIIAVFHDINHAIKVSDYVFLLNEGRIYLSGTSDEVITEETVKKVYDIYVHVCNFRKCCHKVVVPGEI
jgi:ABC-type cobalamin/Fe3+-siderophores transport system ATPase subunit